MSLENRIDLYSKVSVNGNTEVDYLSSKLPTASFQIAKTFRVPQFCEGRLDLISYINYNTPYYWWLIAEENNITDPFSQIVEGIVLDIPYINDYYNFYNANV